MNRTYRVTAHYDADAKVWWAEGVDVPGLIVEGPTFEAMLASVRELLPQMVEANLHGQGGGELAIEYREAAFA